MAHAIVIPSVSVSPAGTGSVVPTATTTGSIPNRTYNASEYKNYKYVVTPAPGYRFVRLDVQSERVNIDHDVGSTETSTDEFSYPVSALTPAGDAAYKYESAIELYYGNPSRYACGAAYWWERYQGRYEEYITSIAVVAVFEPRNTGQLVYSPGQNGQLVYSGNQNGALVYDGDFADGTN